jgi:histidine ammonia-lyase
VASATAITIDPGRLSLVQLRSIWQARVPLILAPDSRVAIEASAAAVQRIVARGHAA